MKKFMKAIAFATVMCLVLSTAAFAAVEVDFDTKAVDITVEGAQTGEQVALIITKGDAEDYTFSKDTILFVDQNATGEFATTIVGEVETIDVYAGYASNTGAKAVLVAEDVELTKEEVLELTITLADVQIENNITFTEANAELGYVAHRAAEGTKGAVVKLTLNVANATAEDEIAGMFWGFEVKNDETAATATKYVRADQTIVDAINSKVLSGGIELAAALNSTGYEITGAKAVLSVNGEDVELVK